MADASNMSLTPDRMVVTPIYGAMLQRAIALLGSGSILDAAEMLTTVAETMRRFQHTEAIRVAN